MQYEHRPLKYACLVACSAKLLIRCFSMRAHTCITRGVPADALKALTRLEKLSFANNRLKTPILDLTQHPRLTSLDLGGNPLQARIPPATVSTSPLPCGVAPKCLVEDNHQALRRQHGASFANASRASMCMRTQRGPSGRLHAASAIAR
jgi:hypothetical protein